MNEKEDGYLVNGRCFGLLKRPVWVTEVQWCGQESYKRDLEGRCLRGRRREEEEWRQGLGFWWWWGENDNVGWGVTLAETVNENQNDKNIPN